MKKICNKEEVLRMIADQKNMWSLASELSEHDKKLA